MHKWLTLLIASILFSGCSSTSTSPSDNGLVVFAASSLTNAFMEIADAYESSNPDVDIVLNFSSSAQLAAQLIEGSRADIFASANQLQMENVIQADLIEPNPAIFAHNQLTLLVPANNPAQITALEDLSKPGLTLILASPSTPVRVYSDQVIQNYADSQFTAAVYQNLASEEANVRQVVTKIALGEGDVGIVYNSDLTPDIIEHVKTIPIPPEVNITAEYPIAPLKASHSPQLAQSFIEFVLSTKGQEILKKWGFSPAITP